MVTMNNLKFEVSETESGDDVLNANNNRDKANELLTLLSEKLTQWTFDVLIRCKNKDEREFKFTLDHVNEYLFMVSEKPGYISISIDVDDAELMTSWTDTKFFEVDNALIRSVFNTDAFSSFYARIA